MRSKLAAVVLSAFVFCASGCVPVGRAADAAQGEGHLPGPRVGGLPQPVRVLPQPRQAEGGPEPRQLRRRRCRGAARARWSSRAIPTTARSSWLVTHKEEPKMPPNSPKIPDAEIDVIRKWIEGGALENSGSVAAAKAKPKFEFKLDPAAMGKPAGPPAMPENLSTEPFVPQAKPSAVVAMAASPWAPLVAVAGHKQVLLYRTTDHHLVGVLPFPEGTIYVLKFSRNGDLLLAGGGRGGQSGLAVAWDVKKGNARLRGRQGVRRRPRRRHQPRPRPWSPSAGPSKVVRVYNTADGSLAYEMKKHTEWITAVEFSPDGVLLATGDRNNGLIVWEAQTGREFYDLRGHTALHHRRELAARLERRRLVERGRHGQALGDGERQQHQEHRRPRRRRRLGPVRQGRPARHDRPRPRGPALGPERQQAARLRGLRRPGPRGRDDVTTSPGSSRPTGRARSASGTPRTAAGWRTSRSTPPRRPSGSSRRSRPWPPPRPRPIRSSKQLAPLQNAAAAAQAAVAAGPGQGRGGRAGRRPSRTRPSSSSSRSLEGEGGRGRRGAGRRSRPPSSSRRRRPRPSRRPTRPSARSAQAEKAATDALERRQGRRREGPGRQDRPRPGAARGRRGPQGGRRRPRPPPRPPRR